MTREVMTAAAAAIKESIRFCGSDGALRDALELLNKALAQPDEDELIIQYHEATIKRLEKRIDELMAQPLQEPVGFVVMERQPLPEHDILDYVKGIYDFLESTSPTGFAQEVFRLPPSPTRNQRSLFDAAQGHSLGQLSPPAGSYTGVGRSSAGLAEPPQRQPLTHEQRLDLLTKFAPEKNSWNAISILIDMVEAAHDIGDKT